MRKKGILILIVAVAAIIATLFYNRSRMEAESNREIGDAIPVSVVKAVKERVQDARTLVGTITANNDVAIVSEVQGKVTGVFAEVGQYKSAGAVLLQIDDELKKAAFASAETNFEKAKKDLERFTSLVKENSATDQQLESARLAAKATESQYIVARRQLNDTKITTPISGIVTSRSVDIGTYVQNGTTVANVVDISKLKVKLNVAERDIFRLKVGDGVEVTTDVYPGVVFKGQIYSLSSKSDEAHTYPVEIRLDNSKEHPLRAGMFGRVSFRSTADGSEISIPREALVGSLRNPQVYVVDGSVAKLRNIVVGTEYGVRLSVVSGLSEGETIVVNGQNNLKDNAAVTVLK